MERNETPGLRGLIVPVLTPFAESGGLDRDAYVRHLDFMAGHGVRRLLANGTTGEFFSMTREERRELFTVTRDHFAGSILFHVGCCALPEAIAEARWAEEQDADAVVAAAPFYLARVSTAGLVDYFRAMAEAVSVPLILYNFPKHTQNPLSPESLAQIPHYGMKDSSCDLSLIAHTPRYYLGGDPQLSAACKQGAVGFVSATANCCPWLHVAMEKALVAQERERIAELQGELTRVTEAFSALGMIPLLKQALSWTLDGYPTAVRPPLVTPDKPQTDTLAADLPSLQHSTDGVR